MEVFTLRTCRGRGGCRITIMFPCTHTNTQTPTHIFVHNRVGRKKDDVPEVPPELTSSRTSANSTLVTCINTKKDKKHGQTGAWVASSHGLHFGGSDMGFVCRKFLWACSFWGRWCVLRWKYASRHGRDQHVGCLCYVWIENSCDTCVKSTPSWVVKFSTDC